MLGLKDLCSIFIALPLISFLAPSYITIEIYIKEGLKTEGRPWAMWWLGGGVAEEY